MSLTEEATFGVPEASGSGDLSGVLASVSVIRVGLDSVVYVLDTGFKKVIAFSPSGSVITEIGNGFGDAPGELRRPISFDLVGDSILAVLDYDQGRITFFTTDGQLRDFMSIPRSGRDMLVVGDSIWMTYLPAKHHFAWVMSSSGEIGRDAGPVSDEDLAVYHNAVGALTYHRPTGTLLIARNRPGLWYEVSGENIHVRGAEAMPEAREITLAEGKQTAGASTWGIAPLGSDHLVILYHWKNVVDDSLVIRSKLDFYHLDGSHIGEAAFDGGGTTAVTARNGYVYIGFQLPFPHVVKYRTSLTLNLEVE